MTPAHLRSLHQDGREFTWQARIIALPGPDGSRVPVRGIQSGTYEAGKPALRARYRVYQIEPAAHGRPILAGESLRVFDPERSAFVTEPNAMVDLAAAG
jgi:hypothetical protein